MTHFACKYIGLPWVAGAQGPDEFDCWGMVRWILYNKNGYEKALAKIDKMDTEDVKSYIKKLIKDDMILGIQIIKNSH